MSSFRGNWKKNPRSSQKETIWNLWLCIYYNDTWHFMYWHYMLFNIVFMCKFVVTLSTLILGTLVYWYFFKQRYWAHNGSFTHEDRRKYTTLSEHIWDIHDQQLNYNINLKIIEKTSGFNPITLQCKICLSEIVNILNPTLNPNQYSLNKCHKTFTLCRHLKKKIFAI